MSSAVQDDMFTPDVLANPYAYYGRLRDTTDKPEHRVYNTGGQAISIGEIADIVREYLPDAQITPDKETGGRELSGNCLIDNTPLVLEFGVQYRPYRERVLQIINDIRKEEGLPEVSAR